MFFERKKVLYIQYIAFRNIYIYIFFFFVIFTFFIGKSIIFGSSSYGIFTYWNSNFYDICRKILIHENYYFQKLNLLQKLSKLLFKV